MTDTAELHDPLLPRLRRATAQVFGESAIGSSVLQRCDDYDAERHRLLAARGGELPVIAVIGATGQGKTWLIHAMIVDSSVRKLLPCGDRAEDRTRYVTWIGPRPPEQFDPARERYLPCLAEQMQPVGASYLLIDTPGLTNAESLVAEAARGAVAQASAHLLVIRRDQLRAGEIDAAAILGEGALVVPVVNAIRVRDAALEDDVAHFLDRLRSLAPTSQILDPVLVDDCESTKKGADAVARLAANELSDRLGGHLRELAGGRRLQTRLSAAKKRFRRELADALVVELPELSAAESRLGKAVCQLPMAIANTLIGSPAALTVVVRTKLRVALLNETPSLCFPYRALLVLLNLTHGAWDRLMLGMAGSLPSLITAAWSSASNLRQMSHLNTDKTQAIRDRAAAIVQDRIRPLIATFRRELNRLRNHDRNVEEDSKQATTARMVGLDALQDASQGIFEEQVTAHAVSAPQARGLGIAGTALFWLLMAGPIIALYREYLAFGFSELIGQHKGLEAFPHLSPGTFFTSLVVSGLPMAVFGMCVLTWAQSSSRVKACASAVEESHRNKIHELASNGTLQLEFDDPLLNDARLVLSLGQFHEQG
jgi:hypothetical protein